jgi:hypothetical protein
MRLAPCSKLPHSAIGEKSMSDVVIVSNLLLTFALGVLIAALATRLSRARESIETVASTLPTDEEIQRRIAGLVERALPGALHDAFEDRVRRLAALREEMRLQIRHETKDAFERPEIHEIVERVIQDKLTRGAFSTYVKSLLDEQYRTLSSHIEQEVMPKLVTKGLADSQKILLGKLSGGSRL